MGSPGAPLSPSLHALLAPLPRESPPTVSADAAVLMVLREGAGDVEVLLIERTVRDEDPASGHVALPGGRVEGSDADLRATALRELREEVGLLPGDLFGPPRHVGTDHARRFRMNVGVFAAGLQPNARSPLPHSVDEVAHVFWLPRSTLQRTEWVERETARGPLEVPATVFGGRVLWGFTRRVVRHFFAGRPLAEPDEDDREFAARMSPPEDSLTLIR